MTQELLSINNITNPWISTVTANEDSGIPARVRGLNPDVVLNFPGATPKPHQAEEVYQSLRYTITVEDDQKTIIREHQLYLPFSAGLNKEDEVYQTLRALHLIERRLYKELEERWTVRSVGR